MTGTAPDRDLSLLGLADLVKGYLGHIEDMSDDKRVLVLGQFAGAVSRLEARVRELYAKADNDGYREALPDLHQVMIALGAAEDWNEGNPDGEA